MYKMATAGVPSGTILAVHLQKCLHLSNERVMQNLLYSKSLQWLKSGPALDCPGDQNQ
jgi:hypothetical protein